jgi:hypothetical protein
MTLENQDSQNHEFFGMEEEEEEDEENILDANGMNEQLMGDDDQLLMRFCPHDSSMLYPKVYYALRW